MSLLPPPTLILFFHLKQLVDKALGEYQYYQVALHALYLSDPNKSGYGSVGSKSCPDNKATFQ